MVFSPYFSWIFWDPPRFAFTIPLINRPIAWYGIFFAGGFVLGFFIVVQMFKKKLSENPKIQKQEIKNLSYALTDQITWFIVAGTIIGARLGHVFFYEWPRYRENIFDIFKIWEGGLASHGGTIGVMLALFLFYKKNSKRFPEITYVSLLDMICIPAALTVVWIRIGNFFNQEIIGPVTTVPWAVIFGHPVEQSAILPRHPTQLYEAFVYLLTFIFLYTLWRRKGYTLKPGTYFGLFMTIAFSSRFLLEFLKLPHSLMIEETFLLTGQYLSLPFIALGILFLVIGNRSRRGII